MLVSPRIRGTNTPLKIYSYLRSGKPIVATDLLTHTQVLSPEVARLVPRRGRGVCRRRGGATRSIPRSGRRLARAAARLADEKYSRDGVRAPHGRRRYAAGSGAADAAGRGRPRSDPGRWPAVNVLVTGATGFTGGHLATTLARRGDHGPGAGAPEEPGARFDRSPLPPPACGPSPGISTDRASVARAAEGVEVVYHIAATYREAGQPDSAYRAINVDGTRHVLEAAKAAGAGASSIAAPAACTATSRIRRPTRTRRSIPGDVYQETKLEAEQLARAVRPAPRLRRGGRAADRHLRPGRYALPQDVSRHRARAISRCSGRARCSITSPTSTIWSRASACAAKRRRAAGRTYILAGPAVHDAERAGRARGAGAGRQAAARCTCRCGRSGPRACCARWCACRCASSRRSTGAAWTSTRRAARSTRRAPERSSASRRRWIWKKAFTAPRRGTGEKLL